MPHATASWLVDNTSLSFEQIAEFCGLHILEVQAIADDTAATKLTGRDPVRAHELTQDEIDKGQADPDYRAARCSKGPEQVRRTKGPRYTPVSKRQDKPDGIAWIIRNHPEISDGAIGKLIGTTRTTIAAIRDRSHWNIANITPKDPVTLGLMLAARARRGGRQGGQGAPASRRRSTAGSTATREALIEELRAEREATPRPRSRRRRKPKPRPGSKPSARPKPAKPRPDDRVSEFRAVGTPALGGRRVRRVVRSVGQRQPLFFAEFQHLGRRLLRGRGLGRVMRETAFDRGALFDRQRVVMHVAFDHRAFQDHQLAHGDRALDGAGKARGFGADRAFDAAALALHQRGAVDVAVDRAVDMQVGGGGDVALDGDVGADHRESRIAVSHGPRGSRLAIVPRASSRTWGAFSRNGRGLTARSLMRTSKCRCGPVERPVLPIGADHVARGDLLADRGLRICDMCA